MEKALQKIKLHWKTVVPAVIIIVSLGNISYSLWMRSSRKMEMPVPDAETIVFNNALPPRLEKFVAEVAPAPRQLRSSLLSGVYYPVNEADYTEYPYVVVVNNHEKARPQSGLSQAAVVYEVLAEGGITRFVVVYDGHTQVEKIGPVRSLRYYMIELALGYQDPVLLHHGWAGFDNADFEIYNARSDARGAVSAWGVKSLQTAGSAYRDSAKAASSGYVHSLYTDSKLIKQESGRYQSSGSWDLKQVPEQMFSYKGEQPIDTPVVNRVDIDFLGKKTAYSSSFQYDEDSNSYLRYYGDLQDRDITYNLPINPKNVIIQWHEFTYANDGHARIVLDIVAEGSADILIDGNKIPATWKKECRDCQINYYNIEGNEIKFNRGQTWVVLAVKIGDNKLSKVSYQ